LALELVNGAYPNAPRLKLFTQESYLRVVRRYHQNVSGAKRMRHSLIIDPLRSIAQQQRDNFNRGIDLFR
jgi:hypothetical protein